MINLLKRMLPDLAGIEPATSWSPAGLASNWAMEASAFSMEKYLYFSFFLKKTYIVVLFRPFLWVPTTYVMWKIRNISEIFGWKKKNHLIRNYISYVQFWQTNVWQAWHGSQGESSTTRESANKASSLCDLHLSGPDHISVCHTVLLHAGTWDGRY